MALTRGQAKAIVDAVRKDSGCVKQIESWLSYLMPDGAGLTGVGRNIYYSAANLLTLRNPLNSTYPDVAPYVCHGIAKKVASTINAAVKARRLPDVELAMQMVRVVPVIADVKYIRRYACTHWACRIRMTDKSEYVFDWHQTLNISNPIIYRKGSWSTAKSGTGTQVCNFKGCDVLAAGASPSAAPTAGAGR